MARTQFALSFLLSTGNYCKLKGGRVGVLTSRISELPPLSHKTSNIFSGKYISDNFSFAMRAILAMVLLLLGTQLATGHHFNCANVCAENGIDVSHGPSGSHVGLLAKDC